jgi:sigma-B regulation protein RsbU (phosphoserine phosphatase)
LLLHTANHDTFTTLISVQVELSSKRLILAGAGHPKPILFDSRGGVHRLECGDNAPLGIVPRADFSQSHYQMKSGDTLLLFTDGVLEVRGPGGEMYGPDRLGAFPGARRGADSSLVRDLYEDLLAFARGRPIQDDITLVSIAAL